MARTGAQFLARLRVTRRLPVLARLDDGSHLSRIGELAVRIVAAASPYLRRRHPMHRDYRLAITLTDHPAVPPADSSPSTTRRWEHEIAYLALHHTLAAGRVLRSTDPPGLEQECRRLLTVYQALRRAIVAAVDPAPAPTRTGPAFRRRPRSRQICWSTPSTSPPTPPTSSAAHRPRPVANLLPPDAPPSVRQVDPPRRVTTRPTPIRTHADHQPHRHHQRRRTEACDTRTEVVDNSPRTLTPGIEVSRPPVGRGGKHRGGGKQLGQGAVHSAAIGTRALSALSSNMLPP